VTQMLDVGMRERGRQDARAQRHRREGNGQAPACGGGEESHREAFAVGEAATWTLTDASHTLRYLRVSTSVGIKVSMGPSTPIQISAQM
jgi:hypothetical protein